MDLYLVIFIRRNAPFRPEPTSSDLSEFPELDRVQANRPGRDPHNPSKPPPCRYEEAIPIDAPITQNLQQALAGGILRLHKRGAYVGDVLESLLREDVGFHTPESHQHCHRTSRQQSGRSSATRRPCTDCGHLPRLDGLDATPVVKRHPTQRVHDAVHRPFGRLVLWPARAVEGRQPRR